ncbi:MAG TPA: PASTA domain-containing protein [Solirubrobacteraceae bacterium]|nr:PASTA domain-containing protein [Solirubrobacteraceae bacterium]
MSTSAAVTCPRCGAENPAGNHFCGCGAYLAWGDLPEREAPDEATTAALPAARTAPRALLRLTTPGAAPDEPAAAQVEPGGSCQLVARVRNESDIVDWYTLEVDGVDEAWVTLSEPSVRLLPVGPRGGYEREVAIVIAPPRTSAARAGTRRVTVRLHSRCHELIVATADAQLTIEPFTELTARASPQVVAARRRARVTCEVTNSGNAPADVTVLGEDPGEGCVIVLPPPGRVREGATARFVVSVRAARPRIVGLPATHRIELSATARDLPRPAVAPGVLFRRLPWIPLWLALLVALLLLLALLLWLLLPRKVTMPAVVGEPSAFAAQEKLDDAGLRSTPAVVTRVQRQVAPGTVLEQTPPPGERVERDKAVSLLVAAAPGNTVVPRLIGLRPKQADARLAQARLTLGTVAPRMDPKARIRSQVPAAGAQRRRGTAVNVVLRKRRVRVPSLHGRTPEQARRVLKRRGLRLAPPQPKLHTKAPIASQLPAAGTRAVVGTAVKVVLARRKVLVPNLLGLRVVDAEKALTRCELTLDPAVQPAPAKRVLGQLPRAGEQRARGTVVKVRLVPKAAVIGKANRADPTRRQRCRPPRESPGP